MLRVLISIVLAALLNLPALAAESPRRYASIEGAESIYLVDDRALNVVRDMIREGNRKAKKDAEKGKRRERIPSEALPQEEEEG